MRVKRILVTLGAAIATTTALVGCGYVQKGEANYEDEIKTIDLTEYANFFYQKELNGKETGKSDEWSQAVKTYKASDSDIQKNGAQWFAKTASGDQLDPNKVKGLKSISYSYYNRNGATKFSQFSKTTAVTGNPKAAGEYWCVLSFEVDEHRYKPIDDWYAMINIYNESPYTDASLEWNDSTVSWTGQYQTNTAKIKYTDAEGTEKTVELVDGEESKRLETAVGLTGIYNYKYTYYLGDEPLNKQPVAAGNYTVKLTLTTGDFYVLPKFEGITSDGEISRSLTIASDFVVSFDMNGHGQQCADLAKNSAVYGLPEPSETKYRFDGWYYPADYADQTLANTKAENGQKLASAVTLIAHWTQVKFDVTYVSGLTGVSSPAAATAVEEIPTLPTLSNTETHEFAGWVDSTGATVTAGTKLEEDTTLYAKWNKIVSVGTLVDEDFTKYTSAQSIGLLTTNAMNLLSTGENGLVITGDSNNRPYASFGISATSEFTAEFEFSVEGTGSGWRKWGLFAGDSEKISQYDQQGDVIAFRLNGETTNPTEATYAANTVYKVTLVVTPGESTTNVNVTIVNTATSETIVNAIDYTVTGTVDNIRFGYGNGPTRAITIKTLEITKSAA